MRACQVENDPIAGAMDIRSERRMTRQNATWPETTPSAMIVPRSNIAWAAPMRNAAKAHSTTSDDSRTRNPLLLVTSRPFERPSGKRRMCCRRAKIGESFHIVETLPRSVLDLLAPDSTPEAVRTKVIQRAEADTPIAV
jgi:hypothetical protein